MKNKGRRQINGTKILAQLLLVLAILIYIASMLIVNPLAVAKNEQKNILIERHAKGKVIQKAEKPMEAYNENEAVGDMSMTVTPLRGTEVLENNGVVYEGDYIKYNIKLVNNTEETMNDVKIVASIPEGVKYAELTSNFQEIRQPYYYTFEEEIREKEIEVGEIEAGQTKELFYEVKVKDLLNDEETKTITTNINVYVEDENVQEYELTNIVNPADVQMFMGAFSEYGGKQFMINIKSDTQETVDVKIHLPKMFELKYISKEKQRGADEFDSARSEEKMALMIWSSTGTITWQDLTDEQRENPDLITEEPEELTGPNAIDIDISEDNVVTTTLETNKVYTLTGSLQKDPFEENSILSSYIETADSVYKSNETRMEVEHQEVEISMSSDNADEEIKMDEEIEYNVTVKNIGSKTSEETVDGPNYVNVSLLDFLPAELEPISVTYDTWTTKEIEEELKDGNHKTVVVIDKKEEITQEISGSPYNEEDGSRAPDIDVMMLIPQGETANIKIKAKAKFVEEDTLIENMATVEGIEIKTKTSNKIAHTILKYEPEDPDPEDPDPEDPDPENPDPENPDPEDPDPENPTPEDPEKPGTEEPGNSDPVIPVEIEDKNKNNANKTCDFEINKYISKVTVKTVNGTKENNFNNEQLAKTEIRAKELNGATVVVEYKIVIKNIGNIAGTIGEIIDYLPEGLTFSSALNKEWTQIGNGQLRYAGSTEYLMQAGEVKTISLIATKQMSSNTTGSFINKAEIKSITSTTGRKDTNTTNNISQAELIISTSTGEYVYIGIGIATLIGLIILVAVLVKKGKINIKKISKATFFMVMLGIVLFFNQNIQVDAASGWYKGSYHLTSPASANDPNTYSYWYGGPTGTMYCLNGAISVYYGQTATWSHDSAHSITGKTPIPGTKKEVKLEKRNDEIEMHESGDSFVFGPFSYYAENANSFKCEVNGGSSGFSSSGFSNGSNSFYLTISKEQCKRGISSVSLTIEGIEEEDYRVSESWTAYYSATQPVCTYLSDTYRDIVRTPRKKTITWTNIRGAIEIQKVDSDNPGLRLSGVTFRVSGPSINGEYTTGGDGIIKFDNLKIGTYSIEEVRNQNYGYVPEVRDSLSVSTGQFVQVKERNIKHTGNLRIRKIDPDSNKPMPGISFKIRKIGGAYPNSGTNGSYISTGTGVINNVGFGSGAVYVTDSNGEIVIYNLWEGTYEISEISIGDYEYYDLDDNYISWQASSGGSGKGRTGRITVSRRSSTSTSTLSGSADIITFGNRRKYVDLSGYVWEDIAQGKGSDYNSVYDSGDNLVDNVDVRIIENGNVASRTYRGNSMPSEAKSGDAGEGAYKFEKLEIDKLKDYKIEFTYNGMSYESIPAIDLVSPNGSKALEGDARDEFNNRFATITNEGHSENSGESNEVDLKYDKGEYKSTLNYEITDEEYAYSNGLNFPINYTAEKYLIKSNTENAYGGGLDKAKSPNEIRKNEIEEITDINQGLCEREQVDLFVNNDINSVKTGIKGYSHIYLYDNRFKNLKAMRDESSERDDVGHYTSENIGVKFGNKYQNTYTQPIYRADYNYNGGSNQLEVYVTYRVSVTNQATSNSTRGEITTKVNKIVDYFDKLYEINAIGLSYNEKDGIIEDTIEKYTEDTTLHNDFKKVEIETNIEIEPQETKSVFIQFKLSKESMMNAFGLNANDWENPEIQGKEGRNLNNVAEITSYSSTRNGDVYGMIDRNSNPNNATPGNETTYENDTDAAPDFKLQIAIDRKAEGTLFLDTPIFQDSSDTTGKTMHTGYKRNGDGVFDNEPTINGITVRLREKKEGETGTEVAKDSAGNEIKMTTGEDGKYTFTDFTPGIYVIEYEWGDNNKATDGTIINVYDYKGTIYNERDRQSDEFWHKKNVDTRYSDAKDDYERRIEIDNPTNTIKYDIDKVKADNFKTMISTTAEMNIKIERPEGDRVDFAKDEMGNEDSKLSITDSILNSDEMQKIICDGKVTYEVRNVDFGIVERARQQLELKKKISKVKVSLANGQVITETEVIQSHDANNNELEPKYWVIGGNNLTNMPAQPDADNLKTRNGYVKIEMDNELIQGATVELQYELYVKNNSEVDYINSEYYHYGTNENNILTLTPTRIIDYLDRSVAYNDEANSNTKYGWQQKDASSQDFKELVAEEVYKEGYKFTNQDGKTVKSRIDEKRILSTDYYNGTVLRPEETTENDRLGINISKLLTSKFGNQNNIDGNEAEIIEINKNGGRTPTVDKEKVEEDDQTTEHITPGNHIPGNADNTGGPNEPDNDTSEEVEVTPSTGANLSYIVPISVGIIVVVILGVGIYFIKKKVLK